MRQQFPFRSIFIATAWLCFSTVLSAQESSSAVAEPQTSFQDIASQYDIRSKANDASAFKLLPRPVLNWTNPQRKTNAGALFVWTRLNRPKAALCIYPNGQSHFNFEFQSLSTDAIAGRDGGILLWEPRKPGVHFQIVKTAPVPSESPFVRLRQMRMLAREFTATLMPIQGQAENLRFLPSPVYRYPVKGLDPSLVDGAMFAFVIGTDPEALLLIEATKQTTGDPAWQFALARMTVVPTQVHRKGDLVWESTAVAPNRYETYHMIKSVERDTATIKIFD